MKESLITYLPMVACDWPRDGRQWFGVVEALHVFVSNLRDGRRAALVCVPGVGAADGPSVVGRSESRVGPWGGPVGRLFGLAQRSGDADGGPGLVYALMAGEGQLRGARGRGRDVGGGVHHARVGGRVLRVGRLAVCMVLVGCVLVLLRDGRCRGKGRGHVG